MIKFDYDPQNGQYVELPSSEGERQSEDDDEEDEFEDYDDLENEELNKSELSKVDQTETNEQEIKSSFKKLHGDEESKLFTEKEINSKNSKSQNIILDELKLEQKISTHTDDKKSENIIQFENELEKLHSHASSIIKRELEQNKGQMYTQKIKTPKHSQQKENMEQKIKQNNLVYEDKNESELIDDQISEKFFQNLSQIKRSNSVSGSSKQIITSSNKQLIRNISKSESQPLNDKCESYSNMLSILSLNKQQSNSISQKVPADKSRGSKLGKQKLMNQNIPQNQRYSSKNVYGMQATLEYLNSIHPSIISNADYGDKTFTSSSSIDPVQYKGSHNFSTSHFRGPQQSGIIGDFSRNQIKSNQFIGNRLDKNALKISLKRSGTTYEEQNFGLSQRIQSNQQKETRSQKSLIFYNEGFTTVKEFEIYFPINNQKTVLKKLRLYHLKTQIKKRKEIASPKKKRGRSNRNRSESKKSRQVNKNYQIIQKL